MLLEVLLKRILFKLNGKYAGVHKLQRLVGSLGHRLELRTFSVDERNYLQLDHSLVRYDYESFMTYDVNEDVIDNLFEYFLDLALELGVE